MPQMAPYNWFMLNILFTLIMLLYIIFLNYIFMMKKMNNKSDKKNSLYKIMW